jgi:polyphenol oxidase
VITTVALGDGVGAAFSGRSGGVSTAPYDSLNLGGAVGDDPAAVTANRRRAAAALGVDPARTVWMRQVHGADVAFVTAPAPAPADEGAPADDGASGDHGPVDAVVTTVPGLVLAVLVADCAPVLLADPAAGVAGAAHSGRPGTAAGVVPALVKAMCERGADPARIRAAIGPAACGGCYEVPAEMRDEVAAVVPAAHATTSKGTPGLDIRGGIAAQLAASGVDDVRVDPRCTIETPDLFSYRRDGRTGRFAGFVWLEDGPGPGGAGA